MHSFIWIYKAIYIATSTAWGEHKLVTIGMENRKPGVSRETDIEGCDDSNRMNHLRRSYSQLY